MKRILSAAALLALVGSANAAVYLPDGSFLASISHFDAPHSVSLPLSGLVNATLSTESASDVVSVTFLGKEAGHINQFLVNGSAVFNNLASAGSTYGPFNAVGPALNFAFKDLNDNSFAPNGGPFSFASYVGFGTQGNGGEFNPATAGGRFDFVLGFNDGATVDADYDDLIVGLNLSTDERIELVSLPAVPEPGTYALMLAGLGAVGFMARRRRAG